MVIRLVSVSDHMPLPEFDDVFRIILGWNGDLGYIIRVHGQEINSFRRKTRSKALHEFKLHRQEKFLYVCDTLDMWEWDVRVLDIQDGVEGDYAPICVGGRGAAPPEFCGGPTGYRLMLKRQREGTAMSDPVRLEAGVQMLADACPGQSAGTWDLLRTVLDEGLQSIDLRLHELGPLQPDRFSLKEANARLRELAQRWRLRPWVEVVSLNTDGEEQRRQILTIERQELAMETLGVNLTEGKALLAGVQDFVVAQQAHEELEQRRACPRCRRQYTTKDSGSTSVSTVFGRVEVPNPRWNRCTCQTEGPRTFRPMRTWLNGQTSPEMLYLETKWASLIPFARATDLLKEVLPVGDLMNAETVRNHLQLTAERIEQELGEERQLNRFEGSEQEWGTTASTRWSDHGGYRWRLRSRGA
jgi:hypothetical protein